MAREQTIDKLQAMRATALARAHRIFQPTANSPLDFEATIESSVKDY